MTSAGGPVPASVLPASSTLQHDAAPLEMSRGHSNQLDSWRALSLIGMLFTHFWDLNAIYGPLGVRMFFVISGFLITGILLRESAKLQQGHGVRQLLTTFYVRRVLRIVPALYLVLVLGWLCGIDGLAETLPWHFLFASNILFTIRDAFTPWSAAHLWTISVEEQFYLFWPWAVLFLSRRGLVRFLIGMILIALCGRLGMMLAHQDGARLLAPTPLSFDALAAGAYLALAIDSGWMTVARAKAMNIAAIAVSIGLASTLIWPVSGAFVYVATQGLALLPMAALVWAAVRGMTGAAGWLLSNPALVYLGKISYAVYLYHYFLLAAYYQWGPTLGIPILPVGALRFFLLSGATIALGSASWHFVERPFMKKKTRFHYVNQRVS